ncbi:MAG: CinA family protein [Planctomycetota bacterium]
MNQPSVTRLVEALHETSKSVTLAITGGGSRSIAQLLEVPGASRTVLEAVVPYASSALADWLGSAADQACSESTARAMAMASWLRARALAPAVDTGLLIGLGATASLVSDRPKRGSHRIHLATQTATHTRTISLVLEKDRRTRSEEEDLASLLVLVALAEAASLDGAEVHDELENLLSDNEPIASACHAGQPEWTELLLKQRDYVGYGIDSRPRAIFPGAFNPPHAGHRRIVEVATEWLGCCVAYEISTTNVDKPPLDFAEMEARLTALRAEDAKAAVVLTDAPTFRVKAKRFPDCTFIVGADTIARVGDPKYYTGAEGSFDDAIGQIADAGCRFLVFGREIEGEFRVLSDFALPAALKALCDEVTADEFREDVSSTELREESND